MKYNTSFRSIFFTVSTIGEDENTCINRNTGTRAALVKAYVA